MIVRIGRYDAYNEWVADLRARAIAAGERHRQRLKKAVTAMADAIRAMARTIVHVLAWHDLAFDEARPKKRRLFWRVALWLQPPRLHRGERAASGRATFGGWRHEHCAAALASGLVALRRG
jgi:hypothetical protein